MTNQFLKNMGFAADDRVVIFHADDVGMCQASIEHGPLTSGATMVPCPWFPSVAAYCRQHPETDLGVHLTFTAEWDSYRWGPLSTSDPASGLMDEEGYFYRTVVEAQTQADPAYIQPEVIVQVERALAGGIDVTHIDTHMGTMFHPDFFPAYLEAGRKYQVPLMILRLTEERLAELRQRFQQIDPIIQMAETAEAEGFPIVDHLYQMPLREPEHRLDDITQTLDNLKPGLTHFIVHPTKDTAEVRAIAPDWRGRVADYQTFIHDELRDYLNKSRLHVIDFRALREAFRQQIN